MQSISAFLPYFQIGLAVFLVGSILLQQTGAGLSEAFGGSGLDVGFHTRRGSEKILFQSSVGLGVLFVITALIAVILR